MLLVSLDNGVLLLLGVEVELVGHGSDSEKVLDLLFGISRGDGTALHNNSDHREGPRNQGLSLRTQPSKPHEPLLKQRGLNALRSWVEYRTRNSPDAGHVSKRTLGAKSYSSTTVPAFPQKPVKHGWGAQ